MLSPVPSSITRDIRQGGVDGYSVAAVAAAVPRSAVLAFKSSSALILRVPFFPSARLMIVSPVKG